MKYCLRLQAYLYFSLFFTRAVGAALPGTFHKQCLHNKYITLAQRLQRWASINSALDQRVVFAGFVAISRQCIGPVLRNMTRLLTFVSLLPLSTTGELLALHGV